MDGINVDYCHVCQLPTAWLLKSIPQSGKLKGWAVMECTNCLVATKLVPLAPGIDHTSVDLGDIDLIDYEDGIEVSLN